MLNVFILSHTVFEAFFRLLEQEKEVLSIKQVWNSFFSSHINDRNIYKRERREFSFKVTFKPIRFHDISTRFSFTFDRTQSSKFRAREVESYVYADSSPGVSHC